MDSNTLASLLQKKLGSPDESDDQPSPDADKLQSYSKYLDTDPNAQLKAMLQAKQDNLNKAVGIASRGPFQSKTPDEQKFEEANLDPLTRGLVGGGAMGSIENVGKNAFPALAEKMAPGSVDSVRAAVQSDAPEQLANFLTPEGKAVKNASNINMLEDNYFGKAAEGDPKFSNVTSMLKKAAPAPVAAEAVATNPIEAAIKNGLPRSAPAKLEIPDDFVGNYDYVKGLMPKELNQLYEHMIDNGIQDSNTKAMIQKRLNYFADKGAR